VAGVRQVACAKATDPSITKAADATTAEATDVTTAEAAHVATTKATTHVASSSASAAAGLCTRGEKAAGKHRACQNHHHSFAHVILLWDGWIARHRTWSDIGLSQQPEHRGRR
jgi:hypothetical protein